MSINRSKFDFQAGWKVVDFVIVVAMSSAKVRLVDPGRDHLRSPRKGSTTIKKMEPEMGASLDDA